MKVSDGLTTYTLCMKTVYTHFYAYFVKAKPFTIRKNFSIYQGKFAKLLKWYSILYFTEQINGLVSI